MTSEHDNPSSPGPNPSGSKPRLFFLGRPDDLSDEALRRLAKEMYQALQQTLKEDGGQEAEPPSGTDAQ
jgi:hypothetical protein